MRRTIAGGGAIAVMLVCAAAAVAAPGWMPTDSGTTYANGVVTLDSRGQADGTSYEHPDLDVAVENGDRITFEYRGPCGGGAPRVFIQGGAYNTFDQDPNGAACGTDADGDGWFLVSTTVEGIEDGTAGHTGIVNDNIANPSVIQVRNLTIGGVPVLLAPAPTSKDECKRGGWMAGGHKNQGECVSSFARAR
jgi:hypothetical protein